MRYDPATIEPKWQAVWEDKKVFQTPSDLSLLKKKPKFYVLDMFPYPSGSGLHVGHPEGYTATDVLARLKRMQGFNVMHPMGWDAFGLPAERAAVRDGIHPAIITKANVDNFRRQIKRLGFSYDWSREISTSDPEYYRWTQWIFNKLYEKGLAYLADVPVNWCPALKTVLANEEVKDGRYVETGDLVERRLMRQWMLRITAYAERLLVDLEELDWPEGVKEMQRNWVGKSKGAEIHFKVFGHPEILTVYTTRPDTISGATFCVIAPEHPLVSKVVSKDTREAVLAYVEASKQRSDLSRTDLSKEKTGVFTGAYVEHPFTGEKLPVWVADYVLMSYGTGAIMAVPSNDERDAEFAKKYDLAFRELVDEGLSQEQAIDRTIQLLESESKGTGKVQYRLRDWLFSRQRYWGEPFPIVHLEDGSIEPLPADSLPVELPMLDAFTPTDDGRPPLARASEAWLKVTLPDGRVGTRETNTMPQWAGSCWYYLRYLDPHNNNKLVGAELENYWMPVDLYIGGVEHAVLHLLYARFWHKVLYDCGVVSTKEPFQKLFNQGMILAQSYKDEQGKYYYPEDIEQEDGSYRIKATQKSVVAQTEKMSKSRYNVVSPDDVIAQYGADSMRLYEMFMGPLEQVKMWQMTGVEGVSRFLHRVWRLVVSEETGELSPLIIDEEPDSANKLWRSLHKTIKKTQEDTLGLRFNTAISQMMTLVNEATSEKRIPKQFLLLFLKVLAPYAPHIAEELWSKLGEKTLLALETWPAYDPALCMEDELTIAVQINGKRRTEITVPANASEDEIKEKVMQNVDVQRHLDGKAIKKVVVVPGRLVNLVAP